MRLSDRQVEIIRQIVRLFGSRVHDAEKGGDVDPLVEVPRPVTEPIPLLPAAAESRPASIRRRGWSS